MSKAVLRIAKIKTMGAVGAAGKHNSRERDTPNADKEKSKDNFRLDMYQGKDTLEVVQSLLPEKVRKNAVFAVEVVMSASPEFFEKMDRRDIQEWANKCRSWVATEFGGGQNVANFTVHLDEQTPHIHAVVVPLKEGKLNCRHYLGGARDVLSKFQDRFAEELMKRYPEIERGKKGSAVEHMTVKEYYDGVRKAQSGSKEPTLEPLPLGVGYTKKSVEQYKAWIETDVMPKAWQSYTLQNQVAATLAAKKIAEDSEKRIGDVANSLRSELNDWKKLESEYIRVKGEDFKDRIKTVVSDPNNLQKMEERLATARGKGPGYGDR